MLEDGLQSQIFREELRVDGQELWFDNPLFLSAIGFCISTEGKLQHQSRAFHPAQG